MQKTICLPQDADPLFSKMFHNFVHHIYLIFGTQYGYDQAWSLSTMLINSLTESEIEEIKQESFYERMKKVRDTYVFAGMNEIEKFDFRISAENYYKIIRNHLTGYRPNFIDFDGFVRKVSVPLSAYEFKGNSPDDVSRPQTGYDHLRY